MRKYVKAFQRPPEDELTVAREENKVVTEQARQLIRDHCSLNGVPECGREPVEKDEDPDFYHPHVPVQYHELSLASRLLAWLKLKKVKA